MPEQTLGIEEPRKAEKRISLSRHAASGAILATFIATLWVSHYLVTTQTIFLGTKTRMLDYVTGEAHNIQIASEALFVVVTRFVGAFGLLWAPITFVIAVVNFVITEAKRT